MLEDLNHVSGFNFSYDLIISSLSLTFIPTDTYKFIDIKKLFLENKEIHL